ncbi:hypothetical protein SPWS13_0917 [Shewanella putrefaciens]|nr:hypothetical protein SPWS13_0917 [Shewanella putrefaciens]
MNLTLCRSNKLFQFHMNLLSAQQCFTRTSTKTQTVNGLTLEQ